MSNSIWHKKHMFLVDRNGQVVVKLDDGTYDIIWVIKDKPLQDVVVFNTNGITFIREYCYIDDLIAQADKAEQLKKENEAMREEFEVWHGNYECEVEEKRRLQKGLEEIKNQLEYRACLECKHCNQQLNATEILKDVNQLLKGETI